MNDKKYLFLIFLISLGFFLLGNGSHGLWDRDEPRYAGASYELLERHDWIVPYFNGEYRFHKPIMIYWLMSLSMLLFGINEFAARFAPAFAGAIDVSLIYLFARQLKMPFKNALLAALMATFCVMRIVISKAATTDSVLSMTVTAALYLYWLNKSEGFKIHRHILFWVILAVSGLTKGPPGIMVVFFTIVTYSIINKSWRDLRSGRDIFNFALRSLSGLMIFSAVFLPWFILVEKKTNGEFFRIAFGYHVVERSMKSFEGHKGPFIYYIPVILFGLFPFTPLVIASAKYVVKNFKEPRIKFLLCWLLPSLFVFSFVKTKLPHYVFPLFPSIIIMLALFKTSIDDNAHRKEIMNYTGKWWWISGGYLLVLTGILFLLGIPIYVLIQKLNILILPSIISAILLSSAAIAGGAYWLRHEIDKALALCISLMAVFIIILMIWVLPSIEPLRPSKNVIEFIKLNCPAQTKIIGVKYNEPSLVFYWGKPIEMIGRLQMQERMNYFIYAQEPTVLIIRDSLWDEWIKKYNINVPEKIKVLHKKKYYLFQRSEWQTLMVVGNF